MTEGAARQENLVARALARIVDSSGVPYGFGLLAADGMVVTCAHVAAMAAGLEPDSASPPGHAELDFPFVAPGVRLGARVTAWRPWDRRTLEDFAGLILDGEAPEGAVPLAMTRGGNVSEHDFLAYGYRHSDDRAPWRPEDKPVWVLGRVTGRVEGGALQLGMGELTGGLRIQTGFSGTPVLDTLTGQVIGLVSAGRPGREAWLAYAISGESVYDAWPRLRSLFGQANPFRELAPFGEADEELFFGRDDLATDAATRIARSEYAIVAGASGAGKTSLVRAGIMPRLRAAGSAVLVIRPSENESLWDAIAAATTARQAGGTSVPAGEELRASFSRGDLKARVLRLCDELASDRVVVVADQFEELLLEARGSRAEFIEELWQLPAIRHPQGRPRVRVVIVSRDDRLNDVRDLLPSRGSGAAEITVGPLDGPQLRAAIEGPVRRSGFARYEEWLTDRIVDDMRVQSYSLPALQVTLAELWRRDAHSGLLRHATYQDVNRPPGGPLATSLDRRWAEMGRAEQQEAQRLMLHLVVPVGDRGYARRTMRQQEASAGEWRIAGTLATARFAVVRATPSGAVAELMHDALIDQWPRLRQHLDDHREFLGWRNDLRIQLKTWDQGDRRPAHLLAGRPLQAALTAAASAAALVSERESGFLRASVRRRAVRRRRLSALTAVVLAIVVATTVVIVNLRGQAEAQAANATANQAAALAEADLGTSLDTAQLLAVGAYQLHDDPLTEAALFQAAAAAPHLVRYYQAGGQVTSLGTAADGQALVTGTATGQLDWFSPASGARHAIQTSLGAISQVAVDAAGDVVMAADKKQAIIWHPGSGRTATVLSGGDGLSIALSPSGQYAAVAQQGPSQVVNGQAANSGKIFVRDDRTGQLRESDYTGYYDHLAFTSARVVTASSCGFWQSFAVPAVARAGRGDQGVCPATAALAGSSSSGQFSAFASNGSSVAWPTTDPSHMLSANNMAPGAASYVTVSDDGKRAAIVEGGTIYVAALGPYSMEPGAGTGTTRLTANGGTTIADFLGGSTRLVSATGSEVALWDLAQPSRMGGDTGIPAPWTSMAGLPPGLSLSPNGRILLLQGGVNPYTEYRIGGSITKMATFDATVGNVLTWHGDKPAFLSLGLEKTVVDDSSGHVLRQFDSAIGGTSAIIAEWAARGGAEVVLADQAGDLWVLNLDSGMVSSFKGAPGSFTFSEQGVAVSQDGRYALLSDGAHDRITAVNLQTGAAHTVGDGKADGVLSYGGTMLIQRDSGPLEIWDEGGTRLVRTLPGDGGYANALAASADGRLIARLAENGVVSVLSAATGATLATFTLPSPAGSSSSYDQWQATSIQFTPDSRTLLAATSGGELTRWTVSVPALVNTACATAGRAMTPAQWRTLISENPPARLPCQNLGQPPARAGPRPRRRYVISNTSSRRSPSSSSNSFRTRWPACSRLTPFVLIPRRAATSPRPVRISSIDSALPRRPTVSPPRCTSGHGGGEHASHRTDDGHTGFPQSGYQFLTRLESRRSQGHAPNNGRPSGFRGRDHDVDLLNLGELPYREKLPDLDVLPCDEGISCGIHVRAAEVIDLAATVPGLDALAGDAWPCG